MAKIVPLTPQHVGSRRTRSALPWAIDYQHNQIRRSVRPIPLNHMPKSGIVFVRNEPRDIREFDRAEQYCRNAPDLHETRHERIGGNTVLDTLCIAGAVIIAAYFVAQLARGAF